MFDLWREQEIYPFSKNPDRLCETPGLLFSGHRGIIPCVGLSELKTDRSPRSGAEVAVPPLLYKLSWNSQNQLYLLRLHN